MSFSGQEQGKIEHLKERLPSEDWINDFHIGDCEMGANVIEAVEVGLAIISILLNIERVEINPDSLMNLNIVHK